MARQAKLMRRGKSGVYYVRIYIPVDLIDQFGVEDKKISLKTKDEAEAKIAFNREKVRWDETFKDIRARRGITDGDKVAAVWQHYEATIDRHEQARQHMPTQADIDAALEAAIERAQRENIDISSPLATMDVSLDVMVMKQARELDHAARAAKLDELRKHLVIGEPALIAHEVDDFIEQNKLIVGSLSPDRGDTAARLMRAEIEGLQRTLERDQGNYAGAPKDPIVKPATGAARETAAPGESIMEVFSVYERENPRQITSDTLAQARRDIGTFVDLVGSTYPVHRIDKKAVREWKKLLIQYPVKATETKAFAGMKIAQIVAHNEKVGKPTLAPRTVNRYLSSLGAFCNWLVNNGYLDSDPTDGMALPKDKKKKVFPFTTDQMNIIFKSPLFTGCQSDEAPRFWYKPGNVQIRDHRFWVPLVMLYSGARPAEVAQLGIDDVRQDRGHWIIDITETDDDDEDDIKTVKTSGSKRIVPIHPELVKLGFLDYHADMKTTGQTRLFPQAERNSRGQMIADFSREFGRYLTRIGVKKGRGLSLYSFRHGAIDAMRRAGYVEEQFGYIFGHVSGNPVTRGYGVLSSGTLEQRVELVSAIAYPDLDLGHLAGR